MIFTSKSCIVLYVICSLTAGEISNFVLGISSFITAIVTAIVLIKQYMLQRKSYQIERKLKQPVFNIKLVTIDEDNDNKHDNEIMTIQNDGYIVKEISKITVNTIFDVSERSKHNAFRIIGYFSLITMYQSLNGLIYKSRGLNNHAKFINVYLDALALYKEHRRYVELSVHHITKIEYTDIYGEKMFVASKTGQTFQRMYITLFSSKYAINKILWILIRCHSANYLRNFRRQINAGRSRNHGDLEFSVRERVF